MAIGSRRHLRGTRRFLKPALASGIRIDVFAPRTRRSGRWRPPQQRSDRPRSLGDLFEFEDGEGPAEYAKLATLSYETVDIDIGYIDRARSGDELRAVFEGRTDVEALLGRPIASAVVFAFGNRGEDTESDLFALEMRRAETMVTTLAVAFAARGDALAADIMGEFYSAGELGTLAFAPQRHVGVLECARQFTRKRIARIARPRRLRAKNVIRRTDRSAADCRFQKDNDVSTVASEPTVVCETSRIGTCHV